MDRLKQIESFVAVATKGSLTAAALAEGVAPAVIGRRIDALEERLGVKLLVCWPTWPVPKPASAQAA
jgi:DNA-binding transcriptional LysR family regulator